MKHNEAGILSIDIDRQCENSGELIISMPIHDVGESPSNRQLDAKRQSIPLPSTFSLNSSRAVQYGFRSCRSISKLLMVSASGKAYGNMFGAVLDSHL